MCSANAFCIQPPGGGVYSSISEVSFQAAPIRGAETACFRRQQANVGSADRRQQVDVGSADRQQVGVG